MKKSILALCLLLLGLNVSAKIITIKLKETARLRENVITLNKTVKSVVCSGRSNESYLNPNYIAVNSKSVASLASLLLDKADTDQSKVQGFVVGQATPSRTVSHAEISRISCPGAQKIEANKVYSTSFAVKTGVEIIYLEVEDHLFDKEDFSVTVNARPMASPRRF